MRIMILGGDGYIGWPLTMKLSKEHDVMAVDNYSKRNLWNLYDCDPLNRTDRLKDRVEKYNSVYNVKIRLGEFDVADHQRLVDAVTEFMPDTIIHLAEIPSAPFSMIGHREALMTLENNLRTTLSLIHAVIDAAPDAHIIKLGTMGEYGTPDYPIKEGWLDVNIPGHSEKFLFPSSPGSLYHVTKVQDTQMLWMYAKTYGLKVTDIMQGPVYDFVNDDAIGSPEFYTNFHYDSLFGTVVNRFCVQAVCGHPLTVYGKGNQTRGYLHLSDSIKAIELLAENPSEPGDLRIVNQISELLTVNEIAEIVSDAAESVGFTRSVHHISNPRHEKEEHFYEVESNILRDLGWEPARMTTKMIAQMIQRIEMQSSRIKLQRILPNTSWNPIVEPAWAVSI